jgi:hypothetical protein
MSPLKNGTFLTITCAPLTHKPFGPVRHLLYVGYVDPPGQQTLQTIRPWCLLGRLTDIKILELARFQLDLGSSNPYLFAPNVIDIRRIRALYPELEKLGLDIALQGPYAEWPFEVLTELARFGKPLVLMMYLHRAPTKRARFMNNCMDYLYVGAHMLKGRERPDLPSCDPNEVGFKTVKPWAEMVPNWDHPDCWVTSRESLFGKHSWCAWSG